MLKIFANSVILRIQNTGMDLVVLNLVFRDFTTISFGWWRGKNPGKNTANLTFLSFGFHHDAVV
jgi:hypothetical protein